MAKTNKEKQKETPLTKQMAEASHDWDGFLGFVEALYSFSGVKKEDSDTVLKGLRSLGDALKPKTKAAAADAIFDEIKEHVFAINDEIGEFITGVLPAIAVIALRAKKAEGAE